MPKKVWIVITANTIKIVLNGRQLEVQSQRLSVLVRDLHLLRHTRLIAA